MSSKSRCAYCGSVAAPTQREHVFPRCLYPGSKAGSRLQRLTVPACNNCNNGWADDEAHFRNILTLAGDPTTEERDELWSSTIRRSFGQSDGVRRMKELLQQMKPTEAQGSQRYVVNPGDDPRVRRIIRKIIRGLSYHHGLNWPVPDDRVRADVLRYDFPDDLLVQMHYQHRDADIVEYWYEAPKDETYDSAWLLRFYRRVRFVGLVYAADSSGTNGPE